MRNWTPDFTIGHNYDCIPCFTLYTKNDFYLLESISATIYLQIFYAKVFCASFLLLFFGHGVLHNHGGDSFFQNDKSCVSPKLRLKSILLFHKDRLEIKSCLLGAISKILKFD